MGLAPFSLPCDEPSIRRDCVRCGAVLDVTSEDQLVCPRCGRVKAWTVSVNGRF
jgi:exosome complex RNA-binding protein Csl4